MIEFAGLGKYFQYIHCLNIVIIGRVDDYHSGIHKYLINIEVFVSVGPAPIQES